MAAEVKTPSRESLVVMLRQKLGTTTVPPLNVVAQIMDVRQMTMVILNDFVEVVEVLGYASW